MTKKICRICREEKSEDDVQELNCHHAFCAMCMMVYPGAMCPTRFCCGTRSADVVVDEMAGMNDNGSTQIAFGSSTTLFKIDMAEKLKCEAHRKGRPCVNIARMVLNNCRHRLCYDCLFTKIQQASDNNSEPHCPLFRCSNKLSAFEIQTLGSSSTQFSRICDSVVKRLPAENNNFERKAASSEILIECFVYGHEHNKKTIILPKTATISDAVNAIIQLMRVNSALSISAMDVFVRKDCNEKKGKYKYEKIPTDAKCSLADAMWTDKTTLVIDAEKQILHYRRNN